MTTSILIEVLGFIGMGLNLYANFLLARMSIIGWPLRLICNVVWLVIGFLMMSPSIISNSVVFAGINIYGHRKWKALRACQPLAVKQQGEQESKL